MEVQNGVERVGGKGLGEENNVEIQVVRDNGNDTNKVEERVAVGFSRLKDVEDEVFEEAIDSPEQLQKEEANFESEVSVEKIDDSVSASVSDSKLVDENLNVGNEVETFEEAIDDDDDDNDEDVPIAEAGSPEELAVVVGEEEVKDLVGGDSVDKIDEGGTSKEVGSDGLNGEKEVSEVDGNEGVEVLNDAIEVDSSHEVESSREIMPEDGKEEELKEDESVSEYQKTKEPVEVSVELQEDKDEGVNENQPKIDSECQGEKIGESEVDTTVLGYANGVHESKQWMSSAKSLDVEPQDDRNGDVKEASVLVDSGHQGETHELNTSSAALHTEEATAMAEIPIAAPEIPIAAPEIPIAEPEISIAAPEIPTAAPEVLNSHSEKFVKDSSDELTTREAYLKAQDNKISELRNADEKVNGVGKDSIVIKEPKKEAEKDQKEKQSTQENGQREILTPERVASSSVKSNGAAPSPARPAGLGRAAPLLEPAPRLVQQQQQQQQRVNGTMSHVQSQQVEDSTNGEGDEFDETREKLQMIRVKFLRLAHRLGQTPHNVVVAQVLYRLGLAEQLRGRNGGRVGAFSFDRASAMAEQLEAAGQEPLDFSCTIMVLGKTGVGKSATINSIFDEVKFGTDAFQLGTKKVQDVVGTVQGIKVRVIDTPGLLPSGSDQRQNEKILHSVRRFIKRTPPDIVLYLDRLDMQSRDFGDMPLLRTITEIFGPSIWFNAIVVLTHAASAPPDGPNGTASSYDMFVTQRSHVVQQAIRQAAGDMRLMNPVSLVENHSACRTNRAGQRVLPNGQVWKPHLLLLSFASKILAEANTLLKLQDSPPGKTFATRSRAPPLPFLLSSLLQSRPQLKLPEEQFGDDDGLDDDLEESSDSEDDSEYEELPPFRSLTKDQVSKLTKAQKKAYFDELEYREKLFMKKQLKEEKKTTKDDEKMAAVAKDLPSDYSENVEEETGGAASVPVPMPDLALPASFDSDNPTHRYRYLDTSNQWLVRPVLETHGWDHDVGYEGINVERLFVVQDKIPLSFSGQVTKDKKDANVQMELASSIKHGEGKSTSLGFDMQTVGKDLAYTLRSETRFCNFRKNKATAGLSVTLLGDALSAGLKVEDNLIANKRFRMVVSGGAMTGRGDVAYGGSLEAQLRDKDYPLGRSLSTLGLSVMDWHGDLAVGCNIQSQVPIGRSTNLIARGNLNNRGAGQISIRVNSSEQLQIALVGLLPLLKKVLSYPQQVQY